MSFKLVGVGVAQAIEVLLEVFMSECWGDRSAKQQYCSILMDLSPLATSSEWFVFMRGPCAQLGSTSYVEILLL